MRNTFEMILGQVEAMPDKLAVWTSTGSFTFRELYDYSLRAAETMRKDGVSKGDRITIELPHCREYFGFMLGAWMLGAAFVPLKDVFPEARRAYVAEDCGAKIRVDEDYLPKVGQNGFRGESPKLSANDLAVIIYTSGSTGRPKGVIHNLCSVDSSIARLVEAIGITSEDTAANPASFSFVVGVAVNLCLLSRGVTNYIVPSDVRLNLNRLESFLAKYNVSITYMPPALLPYFRQKKKTLRMVVIGGERAVKVWSDDFEIVNGYGSTETCNMVTRFVLDKAYDKAPIGKPLKGICAYILDENGNEADEGEICFTGHMATGYLNLLEETAETFVSNPFKDRDGYDVMVRTGDIGKRLPDGNILYVERKDWMVNINGQRVEPGEIASVMMDIKGIGQATVRDFTGSDGQTFLCAYYTTSEDVTDTKIRDYLKTRLPDYMLPAYIMRLDSLPMNASGKVDRLSLPDPTASGSGSSVTGESDFEENMVTKGVREILESITGRSDFRYDENLIHCGLSSLTAIKFTSEVMGRFGVDLDVKSMLGGCSIASISDEIISELVKKSSEGPKTAKVLREKYPLTSPQKAVYIQCFEAPDSDLNNIPLFRKFEKSELEGKDLRSALVTVMDAHPGLKCTIGPDEKGDICMVPHPEAEVRIESASGSVEDLESYKDSFVKPFDMSESLYRFTIFETPEFTELLMDFSHIMFDGSSSIIFNEDLDAALQGRAVQAEEYTMFDVSEDETERINSSEYAQAEKYFSDLLTETEGVTMIQRDVYGKEPSNGTMILSLDLNHKVLKQYLDKIECTENAFFQSVLGYTMSRFTYTKDSCHATIDSGRTGGKTSHVIGMLVRTLPVVFKFDSNESPGNVIKRTAEQISASVANSIYPFTEISSKLGVSADVLLAYQGMLVKEEMEVEEIEIKGVRNTLMVRIFPSNDGFLVRLDYDESMYTKELMTSFLSAFDRCSRAFLTMPTLHDVDLTGEDDVALVRKVNDNRFEYDKSRTLVDLIGKSFKEHPGNDALFFKDKATKYSELERLTAHIAQYVHSKGIGKEQYVGVLVHRSDTMVVAAVGVMRAGAAYQPLDPTYPEERLQFMMEDSSVGLLIAERSLIGLVPNFKGEVLFTDEFENFKGESPDVSSLAPKPEDAMVILYTSGTTGKPKGCVLEQRNLVAFMEWFTRMADLKEDCRYATYASFGFDACMLDIYSTLITGGCLYVIPDEIRKDIGLIDEFYIMNGMTHGFMTTQMGRMFMEFTQCKSLRVFTLGGEALVPINPPNWVRMYNMYGPTENTISVTSFHVKDDNPLLPIGIPNDNVHLYVLDEDQRLVPTGACGELCVSGTQVFRGYLNNPEKTAAVLVTNPYSEGPEFDIMYRTGDVVRMLPDGNIDYIGRRDGMVKIRGFRIELTDIEKTIREFKGIKDATVQAFDAPSGGKFIAAYIVSDEKIVIKDLDEFIMQSKPAYMVPAVTMQIDEIPLTVNSKVDKRKLPVPTMDFGKVTPPTTDVQKRIFNIASEILGTSSFGIETDLFQAGLTSIGIISFNVKMSKEFGIPFQSKDIKENNTIEKLEKFIAGSDPGKHYDIQDDYPLTKSQEGVFVDCMAKPNSTIYNIPIALKIDKDLDQAKLKEAIVKTVNAHPFILTHIFQNDKGDIRLARKGVEPFKVEDIEDVQADDFEKIKDSLCTPFQLLGGRLVRIKLVHAEAEYFFIDIHHIIGDGSSLVVFLEDVSKAYQGGELETEEFSGYEVSLKEEEERTGEVLAKAKKYYDDLLAGYDRDFLPKGDVYHPGTVTNGRLRYEGAEIADKAEEFCRRTNMTVNALALSAFGYNLAKFSGSDHSIFTTVYNGRADSRIMNSMSMFVKTLPVLCNIADDSRSPLNLAEEIGRQIVDSMNNDIYSFAEISRELDVKPDVLLVYQSDTFGFDSFCGKPSELNEIFESDEKEPILIQMWKIGPRFVYSVEYSAKMFTEEFIKFFVRAFDDTIMEFMTCSTLGEVYVTDEATMEAVAKYNDTVQDYDRTVTVVDRFRASAKANPDSVAVVCKDQSMKYGELDIMTDFIAKYIHDKGIGTDQYVGILVPRSIYMVVAAEGVLKSGAAYQPLDPSYPEERLLFMMQDSKVNLLIADRSLRDLVPGYTGDVLFIDELEGLCKGERPDVSAYAPKPEDAMIILYTSGTTGTPKGCVLEHRNLSAFLNWMIPEVGMDNRSRYASYASFGFDACMMDIHSSMCTGATVYIIPEEMRKDLAEIDKYYINNGITHGFMTTQMGRMFMEITQCRSLKAFMTGGEKLVPLEPPDWVRFYNIYGPTECTVDVTTYIVKDDSQLLPIGIPNTNTKLYVMDKNLRIVPVGSCGELCISGPQIFREYLNNPEKTAVTVVPNPYKDGPDYGRLYRTGDVVRLLPDGNIDYIGRRDGMVKVRGFRIELSEVEGIIREFKGIKDATVKAFDEPSGGKSITAYVVSDSTVNFSELSAFITKSKPPYMVPAHFIQLDAIPMTVNGKVDKRKLPEPTSEPKRAGREPSGDLETKLCAIYAEVLGLKKVYADDDFFAIGGTSISASKLVLSCMNVGIPVVYKNIFDNPTPEMLARFLSSGAAETGQNERDTVDETPLAFNVAENLNGISSHSPKRVLLTGSTGYLGVHILGELLRRNAKQVYCLVRSGKGQTAEERLKTIFMYYFAGMFPEDILKNVTVIDADITDEDLLQKLDGCDFDTIINSAAIVKHFSNDDSIEKVNVGGVKNLIQVAKARDVMLVQVSTESVAGESVNGSIPDDRKIRECELDFGQNIENKYIHSKFMAEKAIIEEIPKGLKGKILRMGNLMSRDSDGEFQINFNTNAFMKQMRSYAKLGFFSVKDMAFEIEFSPIDMVAKATVILAGTPEQYTVFHVNNCHKVHMANVLEVMRDNDMPVEVVSQKEFEARFAKALQDETKSEYISGLINYMGNAGESRREVKADESYTVDALYRLGFSWPIISEAYIDKAFKTLKSLRFFK